LAGWTLAAAIMHDLLMNAVERTRWVCEQAHAGGFDLCGVASITTMPAMRGGHSQDLVDGTFEELAHLPEWLAHGYAGEMNYLRDPRRADPRLALEGGESVIVVALNYNSSPPYSTELPVTLGDDSPRGWISRYAWGDDYHEVLREKLDALIARMRVQFAGEALEARAYVDTGPIIERIAAKYAGLGWLAKNTSLINEKMGSWLFLGVIVTTLDLAPSIPPGELPAVDLCGNCRLCLDACPTQAFPAPYVLDASKCISYLTIELRGALPDELRSAMGRAVVGCDICQDVCPWNRKSPVTRLAAFQPRQFVRSAQNGVDHEENSDSLFAPELEKLASLTQKEFSQIFRNSAVKRAKWRGIVRNACVALGNSNVARDSTAHRRVVDLLERLSGGDDPLIAEHAKWALARLKDHGKGSAPSSD
jgi:epoxyqueuosine reductase